MIAASSAPIVGTSSGINGGRLWLTGTGRDFQGEVGRGYDNSVVGSIISLEATMMQEVTLGLQRLKNAAEPTKDESWEWVLPNQPEYAIVRAIRRPNGFYGDDALWFGSILSEIVSGNGYWLIRRTRKLNRDTGMGVPGGFWYCPHFQLEPTAATVKDPVTGRTFTQDGSTLVTAYEYRPLGGGVTRYLDPVDVVSTQIGINPEAMNRGLSPLFPVFRDIVSENEAALFAATLMANMGIPGVIMSSKTPLEDQTEGQRKQLRRSWSEFTKDRRGEPFVAPVPIDVAKIAFSPADMLADKLRTIPASRICAALGYDPLAVKLPSENKTYSNYGEARQAAWEEVTLPRFKRRLRQIGDQLFTQFGLDPDTFRLWVDVDQIRALRDDVDAKWKRVQEAFTANLIDRAEAKEALGMKPLPGDKGVYASDVPNVAGAAAEAASKSALIKSLIGRASAYRADEDRRAGVEQ